MIIYIEKQPQNYEQKNKMLSVYKMLMRLILIIIKIFLISLTGT